jgi:hypothetical protein
MAAEDPKAINTLPGVGCHDIGQREYLVNARLELAGSEVVKHIISWPR